MARISLITPLFPTQAEPYQGTTMYHAAAALRAHARLSVLRTRPVYPSLRILQPRTFQIDADLTPRELPEVPLQYVNYPVFPVLSRPWNGGGVERRLLPEIERERPDIMLAYWIYPEGYAAIRVGRKLGIPVILGSLGSDLLKINDPFTRKATAAAVRDADGIIGVSADLTRKAVEFGARPERAWTVPNGCNRSIFYRRDRAAQRALLGVDGGAKVVMFVGWIAALKGVPELLEAVARLKDVQLVCIGDGPLRGRLEERSREPDLNGRVRFTGRQNAEVVGQWLGAADLLCLPSYSEGCPNVVVEALSSGRPVVASRVGGIPELVNENVGMLVAPGDVDALTSALAAVLERRWDEEAIERNSRRSWEDMGEDIWRLITPLLPKNVETACPKPRS
jgi:teichuronic acid biosynthesis glycosyltransferase TuaC